MVIQVVMVVVVVVVELVVMVVVVMRWITGIMVWITIGLLFALLTFGQY